MSQCMTILGYITLLNDFVQGVRNRNCGKLFKIYYCLGCLLNKPTISFFLSTYIAQPHMDEDIMHSGF